MIFLGDFRKATLNLPDSTEIVLELDESEQLSDILGDASLCVEVVGLEANQRGELLVDVRAIGICSFCGDDPCECFGVDDGDEVSIVDFGDDDDGDRGHREAGDDQD